MKRLLSVVLLLLASAATLAQPLQQGSITTTNLSPTGTCTPGSCVVFDMRGQATGSVQLGATAWTGVGGLVLQATVDGVNWKTAGGSTVFTRVADRVQSATVPSGATDQIYRLTTDDCIGAYACRITALGAVTGSASVSVRTTLAASGSTATISGGGDATASNQAAGNASLASIDAKTPALGTQAIASSQSVTPATSSTWAATQSGTWSTRLQDGSGNAVTSASRGSERALTVQLVDGSGAQITSFGGSGGTASNFGSATPATGTAAGYSDGTNMQAARVADVDSGAGTQYALVVSPRLSASGGAIELTGGAGAVAAGTLRTTQASDSPLVAVAGATGDSAATAGSTGSISAKLRLMTTQLDTLNTSVNADPNYTQAPGSAAPSRAIQVGGTDGTNTVVPRLDPCMTSARTSAPINISTATTTRIITPTASQKAYICGIFLFAAGTQNVGIVEGTGGTCGTGTAGIIGGTTAATGPNLTAQTGFVMPNTGFAQANTAGTNVDVCLITSAAVQLSGVVVYAKAP